MQVTMSNNRTYQLSEIETGEKTRASLLARGWDGQYYMGISEPVGHQRKTMTALFIRNAETGRFEFATR